MDLSLSYFLSQLSENPLLLTSFILTSIVILVNGWTDAPNAIATCVATRCLTVRTAIATSALFNFIGVFIMTVINSSVAETITKIVDLGSNPQDAVSGLSAALFSIALWAIFAWFFGIPTSESHALIAGLSGSAIALSNGFNGINITEWVKVLYGLFISVLFGLFFGFLVCKLVVIIFKNLSRKKAEAIFKPAEIFAAASMSFMHGAQDGQKFIGVIVLCLVLCNNTSDIEKTKIPFWLMLFCAVIMSLGTSVGGKKIIKAVGMDMVRLEKYQGFSADIAASITLLICSIFGIPVSTTHAKTTAIMGVGAVKKLSSINLGIVKELALAWIFTFPCCTAISFFITKLFLVIF